MFGAKEHLVRLCQQLRASRVPANEALAELLNDCILNGKSALWRQLIIEFGADVDFGPSTILAVPSLDAIGQQRLMNEALAEHRQTVGRVYKVASVLRTADSRD